MQTEKNKLIRKNYACFFILNERTKIIPMSENQTIMPAKHRIRQIQINPAKAPTARQPRIMTQDALKSWNNNSRFCKEQCQWVSHVFNKLTLILILIMWYSCRFFTSFALKNSARFDTPCFRLDFWTPSSSMNESMFFKDGMHLRATENSGADSITNPAHVQKLKNKE